MSSFSFPVKKLKSLLTLNKIIALNNDFELPCNRTLIELREDSVKFSVNNYGTYYTFTLYIGQCIDYIKPISALVSTWHLIKAIEGSYKYPNIFFDISISKVTIYSGVYYSLDNSFSENRLPILDYDLSSSDVIDTIKAVDILKFRGSMLKSTSYALPPEQFVSPIGEIYTNSQNIEFVCFRKVSSGEDVSIKLASTDGTRCIICSYALSSDIDQIPFDISLLLDPRSIKLIHAFFSNISYVDVEFCFKNGKFTFRSGSSLLVVPVFFRDYPNYETLFENVSNFYTVRILREEIKLAVQSICDFNTLDTPYVFLDFQDCVLIVRNKDSTFTYNIPCDYTGPQVEMCLNGEYLNEALDFGSPFYVNLSFFNSVSRFFISSTYKGSTVDFPEIYIMPIMWETIKSGLKL